ncbi:MAG: hypothetical protein LBW85_08520 [Deltaproteobacteria bacterium]|nr:hypothetical protein [Deltaproteobacteria bacterium]
MSIRFKDQIKLPRPPAEDSEVARKLEVDAKVDKVTEDGSRKTEVINSPEVGAITAEDTAEGVKSFLGVLGDPSSPPVGWAGYVEDTAAAGGTTLLGTKEKVYYGRPGELLDPADPDSPDRELARLGDIPPVLLTRAEYAALESPPGSGLYPALRNKSALIKDQDTAWANFEAVAPDYGNMETDSVIASSGGTWTADRTGYVRFMAGWDYPTANSIRTGNAGVGGAEVWAFADNGGAKSQEYPQYAHVAPVTAGQNVYFSASGYSYSANASEPPDTFGVFFIPPKIASINNAPVSEDFLNTAMVPDYAAQEPGNKFAAPSAMGNDMGAAWTADRTGFVFVRVYVRDSNSIAAPANAYFELRINGSMVGLDGFVGDTGVNRYVSKVLPVTRGDMINAFARVDNDASQASATVMECLFIPAKFVTVQAPVIVTSGASYSAEETPTGETWIDGAPLFRKRISAAVTFPITPVSGAALYNNGSGTSIVRFENFRFTPGSGMGYAGWEWPLPCSYPGAGTDKVQVMVHNTAKHMLYVVGTWPDPQGACTVTGEIWYTK